MRMNQKRFKEVQVNWCNNVVIKTSVFYALEEPGHNLINSSHICKVTFKLKKT